MTQKSFFSLSREREWFLLTAGFSGTITGGVDIFSLGENMDITKVILTFMDGTQKVLTGNSLKFD